MIEDPVEGTIESAVGVPLERAVTRCSIKHFTADHRYLLNEVATAARFSDPVAVHADAFQSPLLAAARKGELLPIDGALIRDWNPSERCNRSGIRFGARLYQLQVFPSWLWSVQLRRAISRDIALLQSSEVITSDCTGCPSNLSGSRTAFQSPFCP